MDTLSSGRRSLIGLIVSLSAALACVGSLACSSNGSSFDMGGAGSTSNTTNNTTQATGGGVTDPTNTMGGNGVVNPTQAMGGNPQTNGGISSTAGMATGGAGTVGGETTQGGQATGGAAQGGQATGGGNAGPVCPKPAGEVCHEFIANDNGRAQVNYVNEFCAPGEATCTRPPGGVVWKKVVGHNLATPENSPRTIEIVDNAKAAGGKAILVSVNDGYVELDQTTGNIIANVTVQFVGVTGACRLPDGTTALGTNASIRIVSANGVQSRAFNLPAGSNLRAINRDPATGHFWLSKTETVYEVNDQGQIAWQGFMGTGTKGYAVWWRAGGGAYGTTGEPHTIVELNAAGQIVQTVGGDDPSFAGLKLDFFSGFVRTAKGNFIVAHWLGHNGTPDANTPEVIEFEPNGAAGKVVWTWGNQTLARSITNVFVVR